MVLVGVAQKFLDDSCGGACRFQYRQEKGAFSDFMKAAVGDELVFP